MSASAQIACMSQQHLTPCGVLSNHVIGDIKAEDTGMILHVNLCQWSHSVDRSIDGLCHYVSARPPRWGSEAKEFSVLGGRSSFVSSHLIWLQQR